MEKEGQRPLTGAPGVRGMVGRGISRREVRGREEEKAAGHF